MRPWMPEAVRYAGALRVAAVLLLILVGRLAFGVPIPRDGFGFAAAFLLGTSALFALGMNVRMKRESFAGGSRPGTSRSVQTKTYCRKPQ